MATLPLTAADDFDWLFLGVASHDNHALFLALRSGNDELGTLVFEKYMQAIVEANTSPTRNHDGDDSDCSMTDDVEEDSPLFVAEKVIEEALFAAVECEKMPSSFEAIMNTLRDASVLKNSKGRTPLMISAMIGSVEYSRQLHFEGDDPTDDDEQTAMQYACEYGRLGVVELLLAQGPVNLSAEDGSPTPIIKAAMHGHRGIVELLIPLLSSEQLKTDFILAAEYGLEHTMELILKAVTNANPKAGQEYVNAIDGDGNTPLHCAAESNHIRVIQFLILRRAELEIVNKFSMTPLALASQSSFLESMRLLLDAGTSTETPLRRERTVLMEAIFYEREAAVELLLEYGAVPRVSGTWFMDSSSLVEFTLAMSSEDVLEVLLKHFHKMKMSLVGCLGEEIPTPMQVLRVIIEHGRTTSFDMLCRIFGKLQLVIGEDDFEIGSIFRCAARHGTIEMLQQIWEYSKDKVDLNEVGEYHGTALQAAICSSTDPAEKANALINWGAKVVPQSGELYGYWGTALHAAAWSASEDIVGNILHEQSDSKDLPDMMGRLPLHIAIIRDEWALAQQLLSDESPITAEDFQLRHILHMACGAGSVSVVQQILEDENLAESLINKTDIDGWTPLHWACRSDSHELPQILMEKGAKKTARTVHPDIFGRRHQCTSEEVVCSQFDLCFKCVKHKTDIHFPDHDFEERDPY
ncbi:hypothetical protein K4K60_010026 [Colletotrichum sp. SAR11_57]|nr:hypothetical protein K4K60_010026 [Colletotrichum sp. SAR11_57]